MHFLNQIPEEKDESIKTHNKQNPNIKEMFFSMFSYTSQAITKYFENIASAYAQLSGKLIRL